MAEVKLEQISPIAWIQEHNLLTSTGQPFDFHNHFYLFDPFCDLSPLQVTMKAAQIGYTESIGIAKMMWVTKHIGLDTIYVLPTATDAREMVSSKVNRIVNQNPILQEYVKDKDSVEQKQVGENLIYFRGSWFERAALMVSADLLIMDEYDRAKLEIMEQYSSRLQHSKFRWQWLFSNPSVKNQGVDKYWQLSDKRHWMITCPCGEEQYLSWPESIDPKRQEYVCKACGGVLSDEIRRRGEWIPLGDENAQWRGYWINLMMNPTVPASRILEYFKTKSTEYFWNFVLGLPYVGSGNSVSQDMIFRNLTPELNDQSGRIVIGVDTGLKLHYVCGNEQGLFMYDTAKDYDDIERLMMRWPRSIVVMDEGGDIIGSRKLREKYPGRVFLCHFSTDRKTLQLVRWGQNDESGHVSADRNRLIQLVIDEFTDSRIPLEGDSTKWYDFWCFDKNTLITTSRGEIAIKDVFVGDYVLTRKGYKKVYKVGISNLNAEVFEAIFSNGAILIATASHKIWVKDKGFITLDSLVYGDIIETCLKMPLYIKKKSLPVTWVRNIILAVGFPFIEKFGKILMALFQKVLSYIIKTLTPLITDFQILSVFLKRNTTDNIFLRDMRIKNIRNKYLNSLKKPVHSLSQQVTTPLQKLKQSLVEMDEKTVKFCIVHRILNGFYVVCVLRIILLTISDLIVTVLKSVGFILKIIFKTELRKDVPSAENASQQINIGGQTPVQKNVVFLNKRRLSGTRPVYNLSVEDEHEYYANKILVSNCHWSHIYRVSEEDNLGVMRHKWERSDDDHWVLSSIYWRIGMSRFAGSGSVIMAGENSLPVEKSIGYSAGYLGKVSANEVFNQKKPHDWRKI